MTPTAWIVCGSAISIRGTYGILRLATWSRSPKRLFEETDGIVPVGPVHFAALWPEATRALGQWEL